MEGGRSGSPPGEPGPGPLQKQASCQSGLRVYGLAPGPGVAGGDEERDVSLFATLFFRPAKDARSREGG
jgi:hypothetical protein